ncbi:MAG: hypothetical protein J7L71_12185 [Spirochaetaceae bacterium]|nr:hypothetical protein [Spirochaetaceae bacterium]
MNWKEFCRSVPESRTTTLEITEVGNLRKVGKKQVLSVNGIDSNGNEHKELLVPIDAQLEFDEKNFILHGGMISSTKKSYSNPGYDWEIESSDETFTSVNQLFENAKNAEEMIYEGPVEEHADPVTA